MPQLSARTCLKMLRKLIHASPGELRVAMGAGHPGHMLVLIVAVERRRPDVTGVAKSALVTTGALVYPCTSNGSNGISLVSFTEESWLLTLFIFVGHVGGRNDTAVFERG